MKKLMLLAGLYCLQPQLYATSGSSNIRYHVAPVTARDRALTHFKENYAWVQDASWQTTAENTPYCTFHQGNITNYVFYDKHGEWQYTLLTYPPSVLAKSVKSLVLENFRGYQISYVNEIRSSGQEPSYVINIENKDHIKVIQVSGEDFEIRQALDKE